MTSSAKVRVPLMANAFTAIVFSFAAISVAWLPYASALKCYQGQQNSSLSAQGSPMECPMAAESCIKSVDPAFQIATRSCQASKCMLNGIPTSSAVCQNSTAYPFQTFCCCYGDGCNGAGTLLGGSSVTQLVLGAIGTLGSLLLAKAIQD